MSDVRTDLGVLIAFVDEHAGCVFGGDGSHVRLTQGDEPTEDGDGYVLGAWCEACATGVTVVVSDDEHEELMSAVAVAIALPIDGLDSDELAKRLDRAFQENPAAADAISRLRRKKASN